MDSKVRGGLLVGAGFLLGSVGLKALTSPVAKQGYVKAVACGLRAKESYEVIVEQAKAQVDDIMAEASYMNRAQASSDAGENADGAPAEEEAPEKPKAKSSK